MESFDTKTLFTIGHIFGAVLGAGGAYMSDLIFLASIKDYKISKPEMRFMRLGGKVVWTGVAILLLSGIALFLTNPEHYMASTKFLSKMFIVLVIIVNGVIFHVIHIPLLHKHTEENLPSSKEFMQRRKWLILSGAVSLVSWTSTLILGSIRSLPFSVTQILSAYAGAVLVAMLIAWIAEWKLLPKD